MKLNALPIFYMLLISFKSIKAAIDLPKSCTPIITKTQWGARKPKSIEYGLIPMKYVVIHHTLTPKCYTFNSCSNLLKTLQNFHMEVLQFHDIGYNFLVGNDGRIYEGTGWHKCGAHTRNYNSKSLGLAFIGNFTEKIPDQRQLKAARDFLRCAVQIGELDENYKLIGARQVTHTGSPGLKLYNEIRKWPNYAPYV